jgi:hypothetical protein
VSRTTARRAGAVRRSGGDKVTAGDSQIVTGKTYSDLLFHALVTVVTGFVGEGERS